MKHLSYAEIVEIRDRHLPSQGERFDCIAFARNLLAAAGAKEALPPFSEEWAKREAQGYHYGPDALEQVRFGYEIAKAALER